MLILDSFAWNFEDVFFFFLGISEFWWNLLIPWNPVSTKTLIFLLTKTLDYLKSLKSWRFSFEKAVQITVPSALLGSVQIKDKGKINEKSGAF